MTIVPRCCRSPPAARSRRAGAGRRQPPPPAGAPPRAPRHSPRDEPPVPSPARSSPARTDAPHQLRAVAPARPAASGSWGAPAVSGRLLARGRLGYEAHALAQNAAVQVDGAVGENARGLFDTLAQIGKRFSLVLGQLAVAHAAGPRARDSVFALRTQLRRGGFERGQRPPIFEHALGQTSLWVIAEVAAGRHEEAWICAHGDDIRCQKERRQLAAHVVIVPIELV